MSDHVVFSTLGMFIIDLFDFGDDGVKIEDQIGGGGTYATVAARMWLESSQLGMIVDRGSDWPAHVQDQLDSYGDMWIYRDDPSRLTTRARATYNGETRGFEYLSAKKRLSPPDLAETRLAAPHHLHFVCSPTRAIEIIQDVDDLSWTNSTSFVYEPIPDLCIPSEMPSLRKVLPRIEVFSPNHEEAGTFFGLRTEEMEEKQRMKVIEELTDRFLDEGAKNTVVIRCGKLGCYAKQRKGTAVTEKGIWLPPFYQSSEKVVDVTGAGNAFLGGLIAGLFIDNGDLVQACLYGSVSSSYTIEQYGLPPLPRKTQKNAQWSDHNELKSLDRLEEMRNRLGLHI